MDISQTLPGYHGSYSHMHQGPERRLGEDGDMIRDNLYKWVVAPLAKLFKKAWPYEGDPVTYSPHHLTFEESDISLVATENFRVENLLETATQHVLVEPEPTLTEITPNHTVCGELHSNEVPDTIQNRRSVCIITNLWCAIH